MQPLFELFPPDRDGLLLVACELVRPKHLEYIATLDAGYGAAKHLAGLRRVWEKRELFDVFRWEPGEALQLARWVTLEERHDRDLQICRLFGGAALLTTCTHYEDPWSEEPDTISQLIDGALYFGEEVCEPLLRLLTFRLQQLAPDESEVIFYRLGLAILSILHQPSSEWNDGLVDWVMEMELKLIKDCQVTLPEDWRDLVARVVSDYPKLGKTLPFLADR